MVRLDPQLYTVAWIAPLEVEARAALEMLDRKHEGDFTLTSSDDYLFYAGEMCGHNVVIATLPAGQEYGTASAAALASRVKTFFCNMQIGLLVGIAAGLPKLSGVPIRDIRLGDILVALPTPNTPGVLAYELGKETAAGFELLRSGNVLNTTKPIIRSAIGKLKIEAPKYMGLLEQYYETIRDKEYAQGTFADPGQERDVLYQHSSHGVEYEEERKIRPSTRRTHIWYGTIASGDKLMKHSRKRDVLGSLMKDEVIGLEMEAAGVLNVIQAGVIRGVCDYADDHKNDEWQPYAAAMAAAYAKTLLKVIVQDVPSALRPSMPEERVTIGSVSPRVRRPE